MVAAAAASTVAAAPVAASAAASAAAAASAVSAANDVGTVASTTALVGLSTMAPTHRVTARAARLSEPEELVVDNMLLAYGKLYGAILRHQDAAKVRTPAGCAAQCAIYTCLRQCLTARSDTVLLALHSHLSRSLSAHWRPATEF